MANLLIIVTLGPDPGIIFLQGEHTNQRMACEYFMVLETQASRETSELYRIYQDHCGKPKQGGH